MLPHKLPTPHAPCHTHLQLYNNNSRHSHIHSSYRSWWICSTHWRPPSRTAPWPLAPWANATLWVTRPSLVSPSSRATCAPTATRRTSACSATCATLTQTACVRSVAAASSASWDRKLPQFIEHLKAYTNLASSFSSPAAAMPPAMCWDAAAMAASRIFTMLVAGGVPASTVANCIWSAMRSKAVRVRHACECAGAYDWTL